MAGFEYRVNGGPVMNVGNVLQAIATALTPGTTHLFEIRSYDNEGIRSAWVPVNGDTPAALWVPTGLTLSLGAGLSILAEWDTPPDLEPPTAPVLSSAIADSDTAVTMIWTASTDNVAVTGYQTRIDGGSWVDRGLVLTYQYTGLTASTEYDFEVRAYDAAGNFSAVSNLISETTDAPPAAITKIVSTIKQGAASIVSDPVNTTGANKFVVAVSYFTFASTPVVTDSEGNTWLALTGYGGAANTHVKLYYCKNPTTAAAHTFTATNDGGTITIGMIAFSDTDTAANAEGPSGSTANGTTRQPGSLTPSENNCLLVTALASEDNAKTVDSGFTKDVENVSAAGYGNLTMAFKVQTTAGAENPTWTASPSQGLSATMAVFLPA